MNNKGNWDDLRLVLAIAKAGSLSGAARRMGVSHATIFRRLGALEDRLGVTLFERRARGYSATPAGEEAVATAAAMERKALGFERRVAGRDLSPSGTLRVTTTDSLLMGLLSPIFRDFRAAYSEITLEVSVSNQLFSLTRREADVAIRPAATAEESLIGRKIATLAQAVYGSPTLLAVSAKSDWRNLRVPWIGPSEDMLYRSLDKWIAAQGLSEKCPFKVNSVLGMCSAARDGLGFTILPCYLGDQERGLQRFSGPLRELDSDLWLLTHPDLRKTARVRVFLDFIASAIKGRLPLLNGQTGT